MAPEQRPPQEGTCSWDQEVEEEDAQGFQCVLEHVVGDVVGRKGMMAVLAEGCAAVPLALLHERTCGGEEGVACRCSSSVAGTITV